MGARLEAVAAVAQRRRACTDALHASQAPPSSRHWNPSAPAPVKANDALREPLTAGGPLSIRVSTSGAPTTQVKTAGVGSALPGAVHGVGLQDVHAVREPVEALGTHPDERRGWDRW